MDLARFITREEDAGGLEISDSFIRIATETTGSRRGERHLTLVEEPLPAGTFVEGILKDKKQLQTALERAVLKAGAVRFYIVSIVPVGAYARVITFPKTLAGEQLEEAIRLALNFQLPLSPDTSYVDREILEFSKQYQVFVAGISKKIIDEYSEVLQAAQIKTVAIETSLMSAARSMAPSGGARIVALPYTDFVAVAVFDANVLRFSRILPRTEFRDENAIAEEVRRIREFYATEFGNEPVETTFATLQMNTESRALLTPEHQESSRLLVVMGALARGVLPRELDSAISLLSVGTQKAYEYQKAVVFGTFVRNIVVSASVFFVLAYAGVWILALTLKAQNTTRVTALNTTPETAGILADEARARVFNTLVDTTGRLVKQSPRWSSFLEALRGVSGDGITLTNVTIGKPADALQLAGIAATRERLNTFRRDLEKVPNVSGVTIPLTNLEQKANIPFAASFTLTDPEVIYPH